MVLELAEGVELGADVGHELVGFPGELGGHVLRGDGHLLERQDGALEDAEFLEDGVVCVVELAGRVG